MHHLLGLPTEVILWVFESFDSLRDALHLSQCCKDLNKLFNHQRYQAKILESIVIGVSSEICVHEISLTLPGQITSSQKP